MVYKSPVASSHPPSRLHFSCTSATFLSRGRGTRIHTLRILSPKGTYSGVYCCVPPIPLIRPQTRSYMAPNGRCVPSGDASVAVRLQYVSSGTTCHSQISGQRLAHNARLEANYRVDHHSTAWGSDSGRGSSQFIERTFQPSEELHGETP